MDNFSWPWESQMMLHHPWVMPVFLFALAILMSIITWTRKRK